MHPNPSDSATSSRINTLLNRRTEERGLSASVTSLRINTLAKDLAACGDRATLVSVELPLGGLPADAAHSLVAPLLFDPMFERSRETREVSRIVFGPAFFVARCAAVLEAAGALLAR